MNKNLIYAIIVVVLVAVGGYFAYTSNLIPGFAPADIALDEDMMPSEEDMMMEGQEIIVEDVQGEFTEEYVEAQ